MAKRRTKGNGNGNGGTSKVDAYRHESAKRKNNPPAKIAAEGTVPVIPKAEYAYNPHLPPVLRFDPTGQTDKLPELLAKATRETLTQDEARLLAEALRKQQPWLEWSNKRESQAKGFAVDPVALHIHERVSAQAILKVAARQDVQKDLFADPDLDYHQAVQFYRHDIDWSNRLILGDSLQVMSSLARREDLAGKVQMIYMDPPYGIKFASNFQPEIGRRDVKDKEQDLTREPEMVKAYRDTWHLGIHSYLSYLRDRLIVARELLTDSGSIFVQISDENLHRVRALLDEIFGTVNAVSVITFRTTSSLGGQYLGQSANYLLWYARDIARLQYNQLYKTRGFYDDVGGRFSRVELSDGARRFLSTEERDDIGGAPEASRIYRHDNLTSQSGGDVSRFPVELQGHEFVPRRGYWKTNEVGMGRLRSAERLAAPTANSLTYVRFLDDFPVSPFSEVWTDTQTGAFTDAKQYVVQTNTKVIERCILMTTNPGDLVLDPTCGSGSTAYVAEQWGRRWITVDTSRVALSIARQRLLTAKYDFFRLRALNPDDLARNPHGTWLTDPTGQIAEACTFRCKAIPHITLKSIAQNLNLDPIFAKHMPVLDERLKVCNAAIGKVSEALRAKLAGKLVTKAREQGKKSITDADTRRWELPKKGATWGHWQVPFDTDPDWPEALQQAVTGYRKAWRAKMDEVNACIAANADQEELVDQPEVVKGVVRVSGPFTVEAVQPPELSLGDNIDLYTSGHGKFDGEPGALPEGFLPPTLRVVEPRADLEAKNLDAYLDQMLRLLRMDGVRFPNNKQMQFSRLDRVDGAISGLVAEGRWAAEGQEDGDAQGRANVAVAIGPQYGPVTAQMVVETRAAAIRMGYENLVIAGFSFDGAAQAEIEGLKGMKIRAHLAHIRPDVNPGMQGLLKEQPGSQLFTVFGQPRTCLDGPDKDGQYTVTMEGVDIYNPVDNSIVPTGADKVAAWFVDSDYDGRTFCITQAFFPDRSAWEKLAKALNGPNGVIDAERFEAFSGTTSLPFPMGKHKCVAVKVIDPRGNEVMRVHRLQ